MEAKDDKQTLTNVRVMNNNKPDSLREDYFICCFDEAVGVELDFYKAKKYCRTDAVLCDYQLDLAIAIVMGRRVIAEQDP
jgi:hypothetical protein